MFCRRSWQVLSSKVSLRMIQGFWITALGALLLAGDVRLACAQGAAASSDSVAQPRAGAEETLRGMGMIAGQLYDASNGQPIREAVVEAIGAASSKTVSDLEGTYRLSLPPGTYQLKIAAANYLPASVEGLEVHADEITDGSTVLASASKVTKVEVVESVSAVAATAEAAIAERRLAAVVSDSISGEEIRKSVASDAAGALEKVTGVSVVGNGFVYVRGLGERYSATMLNNALLPTTEPEKRVVPLDLFPSTLIDNIKVLKTYTPELPGEFSGGLVQMRTVDFPSTPTLQVSSSFGYNTRTTGDRF